MCKAGQARAAPGEVAALPLGRSNPGDLCPPHPAGTHRHLQLPLPQFLCQTKNRKTIAFPLRLRCPIPRLSLLTLTQPAEKCRLQAHLPVGAHTAGYGLRVPRPTTSCPWMQQAHTGAEQGREGVQGLGRCVGEVGSETSGLIRGGKGNGHRRQSEDGVLESSAGLKCLQRLIQSAVQTVGSIT